MAGPSLDKFRGEGCKSKQASAIYYFWKRFDVWEGIEVLGSDILAVVPHSSADIKNDADLPTVARFALSGQVPRLTDAIILGDRIHLALVKLSNGSSIFTGCDEAGVPLKGHRHAYIFSESNLALGRGTNGEITHVTIYAPAGFGLAERSALESLREVRGSGLEVQLTFLGLGLPLDFAGLDVGKGECPIFAESKTWISRTPFIPTRHPKFTRAEVAKLDRSGLQIGSPEHELRRLLRLDGFLEPAAIIEPLAGTMLDGRKVPWREFCCQRESGDGRRAGKAGYGFRIEFHEAVQGPIAVGYGVHFGMGGFRADEIEAI